MAMYSCKNGACQTCNHRFSQKECDGCCHNYDDLYEKEAKEEKKEFPIVNVMMLPDAIPGACFHGEVWMQCPHCKEGFEMYGMMGKEVAIEGKYKAYRCPNCHEYFKDH